MYAIILQWAPLLLAIASGLAAIILSLRSKYLPAAPVGALCILLFLVSNLSQIEKFSGLGVEATIRGHLEDSRKILDRIKSVTEAFLSLSYSSLTFSSSFNLLPIDEGLASLAKLNEIRKSQDLSNPDVERADKLLRDQIYVQMAFKCRQFIELAAFGSQQIYASFSLPSIALSKDEFVKAISSGYEKLDANINQDTQKLIVDISNRCADEATNSINEIKLSPYLSRAFSAAKQSDARLIAEEVR